MNTKMVAKYLGYLILAEAALMLPSALVCAIYREGAVFAMLASAAICAVAGLAFLLPNHKESSVIYAREGFVIAGAGWLFVSILGAFPFVLSGEIPGFIDAFFESASGFTTTGSSVLADVESMSRGILFWRSFTHWMGGIGVLAFILALVRGKSGAGFTLHLLRAETPGPQAGKVLPKTQQSVRYLFAIYIVLSGVNLLFLLFGGMPLFDAMCIMFGTAGTGGFGVHNDSMASYSVYLQSVTTVFMALFGVNFSLYFLLLTRQWRSAFKDEELRLYFGIMLGSIALIAINLIVKGVMPVGQSLHHSAFTVSSVMTTTGFSTMDYDLWPQFSRTLILLLMFLGAMAGGTGGGFKTIRVLIILKAMRNGIYRLLHPRSVKTTSINGKKLDEEVVSKTLIYLCVYCAIFITVLLLISADGLSMESNISAVASSINNIGPGLAQVGPKGNYAMYSPVSKLLLTFTMLVGRLEIFPVLLLFTPETWRQKS